MRRRWLVLIFVLAACGGTAATTTSAATTTTVNTQPISGSLSVRGYTNTDDGSCTGEGGFDDIREGTQVTVKDGGGAIIGTGRLGAGIRPGQKGNTLLVCVFEFSVPVPAELPFYTIEIADRGELTYSLEELRGLDWDPRLN